MDELELLEHITYDDLKTEMQAETAKCIGLPAYIRLIAMFSGETIYVRPLSSTAFNIRNKQIAYDYASGMNVNKIAHKYKQSISNIQRIISSTKAEPTPTDVDAVDLLTYEDLDETQQQISDCIGFDNLKKLSSDFSGTLLYVPIIGKVLIDIRNREIIKDYKSGMKLSLLSAKYDISASTIRRIIKQSSGNAY